MQLAEDYHLIAPEQAGGRQHHRSNETSLNSVLTCDDSRFRRKAMALCSNDAKGCFDCIVHSIAYICMRRFGIPRAALLSMFQTIQTMKHYIRTAYGDSNKSYGPNIPPAIPYQASLQGNGAAGMSWTSVSTPIVDSMRSLGHGYSATSAISHAPTAMVCFEYVDDADIAASGPTNHTTGPQVLFKMQAALDSWDGLLRITGGALEKMKSYWYLIDYECRQGRWSYKSPQSVMGDISLFNDVTLRKEPIERLPVTKARKSLGIYTRPDGNMANEKKYLRQLSEKWAASLQTRRVRKNDAWYCLSATILKSIKIPSGCYNIYTGRLCLHHGAYFDCWATKHLSSMKFAQNVGLCPSQISGTWYFRPLGCPTNRAFTRDFTTLLVTHHYRQALANQHGKPDIGIGFGSSILGPGLFSLGMSCYA